MKPWNDRQILPPPLNTFQCKHYVDTKELKYICEEMTRVLTKQSPLHKEGALMSRFIYKYDKKFRNDIGFRKFKKVNTCIRRYLVLNLIKDVESFSSMVPLLDDLYLPTKQMLQYLLVRILSFGMITSRAYVTAKQSAVFYLDRVKRGEGHWMSLMPYAVLCRIWSISSVYLQHSNKWYQGLYPFLNVLELKGVPFLQDEDILPSNFCDLVEMKEIDDFGRFNWSVNKVVNVVPIINEDEDCETFDLIKYVNNINNDSEIDIKMKNDEKEEEILHNKQITPINIDVGQPISRESLIQNIKPIPKGINANLDKVKKADTKSMNQKDAGEAVSRDKLVKPVLKPNTTLTNHTIRSVTNSELLKQFISNEDNFRNIEDSNSLTSHLSFMQWHSLKQCLLNLCQLNNKKMTKKLKSLWKEKCLDYL